MALLAMGYSKLKTRHVAQISVQQFVWAHPNVYYWTFTIHENCTDKLQAMRLAKPLFDLIARRTQTRLIPSTADEGHMQVSRERGSYLAFWELQKRGAWHLHLLTGVLLDVNWLRPWMVKRGWGQIMRVERVTVAHAFTQESVNQALGPHTSGGANKLARYLTKYLTKSVDDCPGKKGFTASQAAKVGSIGFQWMPDINPNAYFFYYGRQLFFQLYGRQPKFTEFRHVCRLGYEATEWASRDPWADPP